LNGKNVLENEHVRLGQYHTMEIEKERPFTLEKEYWDEARMDIIHDATNPMKNAEIAALVMEEGLANLCLVRLATTKTCAVITRTMPKKKHVSSKTFDRFTFHSLLQYIYVSIGKSCI
jgi:protein pelota